MDFRVRKSPNRILMHLSNSADEQMIKNFLAEEFDFVDVDTSLNTSNFDLCILSTSKFKQYQKKLEELKEAASPVYLPVLILVKEHRLQQFLDKKIGDVYDDIVPIPVSPELLKVRIYSLIKQRQNSLELDEKTHLANKAVNATDIGISITNYSKDDNPLIFVNEGFERLTGYSITEIVGKNCRFLQNEDTNQEPLKELRKAIEKRRSAKILLRNYRKDGSLFWNELSISPIENEEGDEQYFVGIQNDVTQLVEARNELQELLGEKEILLQEIHHRIKNNLAVIVALLELKIMESENDEASSSLKQTRTRIFSISKVHELLYQQKNLNEIQFREYIEELVDHLGATYSDNPQKVEFILDLAPLSLSLDQAVPCGMLLSELVTNAFKHGLDYEKNGVIEISMKASNNQVKMRVKDNGKGLPKGKKLEDMPKFVQSILHVLLKQLDAEWEYQSDNGFEFVFTFARSTYNGIATKENMNKKLLD